MKKSILLCGIIINLAATQCMPMAAIRSFLSRHTPTLPTVLHAVNKAPTALASAVRNHKALTTSLALVSTAIVIPQIRRVISRDINSVLNTGFLFAVKKGYMHMVKIFLMAGVDINQQDNFGWTALHYAAFNGHQAVIELLLAHDVNPNIADNNGVIALHGAALQGHQEIVELLLAQGVDINFANIIGTTALHAAASNGHQAVIESLLAHNAGPNIADNDDIADNDGETALHSAARNGHQEVVELLLKRGANPNIADNDGRTALHYAAFNGHQEVVELLLAHNANPNIADNNGVIALHAAAFNGYQAIARLLIAAGADATLHAGGRTAEELASTEEIRSYLRSIPQLTADLQNAVERRDIQAVQQLVEQGAPVITLGQDGNPLIHRVIGEYNPEEPSIHDEIARILIHAVPYQASQVQNSHGKTSLHIAASYGNTRIARYLLTHGANANMRDAEGNTPLHGCPNRKMRDLLLEYHADPTIINREGRVPMANNPNAWYDLINAQAQQ